MILQLAYYGDPILRKKAKEVEKIDDEIKKLVENMIETMRAKNGLGLAAPQVKQSLRIFIIDSGETSADYIPEKEAVIEVYINPVITNPSDKQVFMNEGCLSLPGVYEEVLRPENITVEAMDIEGKHFKKELSGLHARAVMHENDHLNGTLFVDRVRAKKKRSLEDSLRTLKKNPPKD